MSELTLENNSLKVTFSGTKAGFSGIWLKNYNSGSAIYNEYNRLDKNLLYKAISGDYHGVYANGSEYWSGDVNWIAYKTTMPSRDLYGKADIFGNSRIEVVKVISGDIVDIGDDRAINSQELIYYFTPDGKGLIKRVRLNVRKQGPQAANLQSFLFMNYVGFSPVSYNSGVNFYAFQEKMLDFDSLTGWSADSGLTLSLARDSLYPNIIPGFTDSEWVTEAGAPTVVSDAQLNMTAGDKIRISHHNAYPSNRIITLSFDLQNVSGETKVVFGTSGQAVKGEENAVTQSFTSAGTYTMQITSGYGDNYLFLRLEQLSGSAEVHNVVAKYLKGGLGYTAYDGSYLANTSLRNCARVQSAAPNNLRLIYNFTSPVKIAAAKGIKLMARSLDNISIEDGAFRILFQKPDDSWVESGDINMFVDYNDTYPLGTWGRFNKWEDSFFGVEIPDGVDEIKAIGIKWITAQAIDWLLDGFGVIVWDENNIDAGAKFSRNMGLPAGTLRMRDFVLRGMHGAIHQVSNNISAERISVVVVGGAQGYGEFVPLTFQNIDTVNEIYQINSQQTLDTAWIQWVDEGFRLSYDAAGIPGFLYPVSVRNISQGESYDIVAGVNKQIVVDIARKNYTLADTLKITYAKKETVDPLHWSLQANKYGQLCIKWAYDSWTIAHDREAVYVDYAVSSRTDDNVACVVGGSNHDAARVIQEYPGLSADAPQLANYATYVFSDPSNELAEGLFIYQPCLNTSGESLYAEAQAIQDLADKLYADSRHEPLSPAPRNYNLCPMVAYGGEETAASPVNYLQEVSRLMFEANATNAVLAGGGMDFKYDRDMDAWWSWGGGLRDSGVNYLTATRNMLRRGYSESTVSKNLNRHRYLLEVSVFAYEHNKRYKEHASIDYQGVTSYQRIWYYQEAGGAYTVVARPWDDFQVSYYDPLALEGKSYVFQYHYILAIPAFWSVVKPASYWGINIPTIYDLLKRRVNYLCANYDTDGVIVSELLYYAHSFGAKDFELYNWWRQNIKALPVAADWPRDAGTGYCLVDDTEIWEFKKYFIKEMLTEMATVAHGHNKLLGCNVEVQNCLPVKQPEADVWAPYTKKEGKYGTCVDTLDYSCDRYGTSYAELLKSDICDLFFVWLYYRYSSFGIQAAYDFMQRFADYKERMLITVGLFPKEDPPAKEEVISLAQKLLKAGFNVCYAGYPPMLIHDSRWREVWPALSNYVPLLRVNEDSQLEINPKQTDEIPFLVRF